MRYQHDCDKCVFLGEFNQYDLYCCPERESSACGPTMLARYGNEGFEYTSCDVTVHEQMLKHGILDTTQTPHRQLSPKHVYITTHPLTIARLHAIAKGLYQPK